MSTSCLFASDYGATDPGFDPLTGGGTLIRGFESHRAELAKAQNLGQLEAMKRQINRGEAVVWCDQGYGWVYDRHLDYLFEVLAVGVILPYFAMRLVQRFRPKPRAEAAEPVEGPS
ncbi:MAG TPA: hypothetical protein VMC10_19645 [Stellaceae bacterium]|nr:hypothetical protein [Stellaceae bacterium]